VGGDESPRGRRAVCAGRDHDSGRAGRGVGARARAGARTGMREGEAQ